MFLFDDGPAAPHPIDGLTYLSDFIDNAAEAKLVAAIDRGQWDESWQRRRQLFGQSYGRNEAVAPIPA